MEQHRELELMNSFRERFGHHWLQYRNHLEASGTHVLVTSETPALSTQPPDAPSAEPMADPLPPDQEPPQEVAEEVRVEPEPQEEEEVEEQGKEDGGKEEEEEQEQNEVQGERSVAVELGGGEGAGAGWWQRAWELGEPGCGLTDPFGTGGQSLGCLALFTGFLSGSLFSGALSPHVGVSPGGARRRAWQGVLSLGHCWPPV